MLAIPPDLCKYLGLTENDTVIIQDDQGKHGPFISLWKKPKWQEGLNQEEIQILTAKPI